MERTFLILISAILIGSTISFDSDVIKIIEDLGFQYDDSNENICGDLEVTFDNNVTANMGNEIKASETLNEPTLDWDADDNDFYTIINLCPDSPGADDPYLAPLNTWMIGNVPGKDVKAGEYIYEYIPASTPRGRGLDRYAILVFQQPGILRFQTHRIDKFHFNGRGNFPLKDFIARYDLDIPIAFNFYRTQYDKSVLEVYDRLQCCYEFNKD